MDLHYYYNLYANIYDLRFVIYNKLWTQLYKNYEIKKSVEYQTLIFKIIKQNSQKLTKPNSLVR